MRWCVTALSHGVDWSLHIWAHSVMQDTTKWVSRNVAEKKCQVLARRRPCKFQRHCFCAYHFCQSPPLSLCRVKPLDDDERKLLRPNSLSTPSTPSGPGGVPSSPALMGMSGGVPPSPSLAASQQPTPRGVPPSLSLAGPPAKEEQPPPPPPDRSPKVWVRLGMLCMGLVVVLLHLGQPLVRY